MNFNYEQYKTLDDRAMWFAFFHHGVTCHMYNSETYFDGHLRKVRLTAEKYIHYIPERYQDIVRAAAWLHDVIEDCRVTYSDVKKVVGEEVADIVYAVTNEKGKNRSERASNRYYQGIKANSYAVFVKLCDRIANIESSINISGTMLEMYRKEQLHFSNQLNDNITYQIMWSRIDGLLDPRQDFKRVN